MPAPSALPATPPASPERTARRAAILDAARAVLAEKGYAGTSMLAIARRARASKETLYAWFGDKSGLFAAMVEDNATALNAALTEALERPDPPQVVLPRVGDALLRLLLGDAALAVNRAAIAEAAADPALGRLLADGGRNRSLPRLATYLERQAKAHALRLDDPAEAAATFVALVIGDLQIRRLLGALPMPDEDAIAARTGQATAKFLTLYGVR